MREPVRRNLDVKRVYAEFRRARTHASSTRRSSPRRFHAEPDGLFHRRAVGVDHALVLIARPVRRQILDESECPGRHEPLARLVFQDASDIPLILLECGGRGQRIADDLLRLPVLVLLERLSRDPQMFAQPQQRIVVMILRRAPREDVGLPL